MIGSRPSISLSSSLGTKSSRHLFIPFLISVRVHLPIQSDWVEWVASRYGIYPSTMEEVPYTIRGVMRHVVFVDEVRFIVFNANIINGIVILGLDYFQLRKIDTCTTFTRYNTLNIRLIQFNLKLILNLLRYLRPTLHNSKPSS